MDGEVAEVCDFPAVAQPVVIGVVRVVVGVVGVRARSVFLEVGGEVAVEIPSSITGVLIIETVGLFVEVVHAVAIGVACDHLDGDGAAGVGEGVGVTRARVEDRDVPNVAGEGAGVFDQRVGASERAVRAAVEIQIHTEGGE